MARYLPIRSENNQRRCRDRDNMKSIRIFNWVRIWIRPKQFCAWEVKVVATRRSIHSPRWMDSMCKARIRLYACYVSVHRWLCVGMACVDLTLFEWKLSPQHPMGPSYCHRWSWQVPRRYFHTKTKYNRQITCRWIFCFFFPSRTMASSRASQSEKWTLDSIIYCVSSERKQKSRSS